MSRHATDQKVSVSGTGFAARDVLLPRCGNVLLWHVLGQWLSNFHKASRERSTMLEPFRETLQTHAKQAARKRVALSETNNATYFEEWCMNALYVLLAPLPPLVGHPIDRLPACQVPSSQPNSREASFHAAPSQPNSQGLYTSCCDASPRLRACAPTCGNLWNSHDTYTCRICFVFMLYVV